MIKRKKNKKRLLTELPLLPVKLKTAWPEEKLRAGEVIEVNTRARVKTGNLAAFSHRGYLCLSRVYFHGSTVRIVGSSGRMTVHKQSDIEIVGKVRGRSASHATHN